MNAPERGIEKLPRSLWVWTGLAIIFVGFVLFWAPQLLLLRALGLDPSGARAARFVSSGFRAFLAWNAGLGRVRVRGARGLRGKGPFVVVANHESYLDSAVLLAFLPFALRIVSKAEIRAIPFLGAAGEAAGVIFAGSSGDEEQAGVVASAVAAVRAGTSVAFFPEGTRSRGRGILRLRKGAFEVARAAGVPVLPVVLVGTGDFMGPGRWLLGRFRITLQALEPRPVPEDDVAFRRALREEMAREHARIASEPFHGGGRRQKADGTARASATTSEPAGSPRTLS